MPKKAGTRSVLLAAFIALVGALLVPATVAHAAPPAPSGLAAIDVGDTNRRLTWTTVAGATQYQVQIADNAAFTEATSQTTPTNSYAPPTELPSGTVHWRVRVTTVEGTSPYATSQYEKVLPGPGLLSPGEGDTLDFPTNPPTFSWSPLATARSYRIEIDDAPDFVGAFVEVTQNNSYTLNNTQAAGQEYYWRVRGASTNNGSGVLTNWSATRSYDVTWLSTAELVKPLWGTTVTDVELEWTAVPGAAAYRVQASVNEDFTGSLAINQEVYETVYSPPTTLNNGSYWWRVQAIDVLGRLGDWSIHEPEGRPFLFTRGWPDRPTPVLPAAALGQPPATLVDPPRFEWSPVERASHYEVQISTDSAFSPANIRSCFTVHSYVTQSSSSGPGGCSFWTWAPYGQQRYWRVRALDGPGGWQGLYSDIHTFVREPDEYPEPVSPADNADVAVPTVDWLPTERSEQYRLRILDSDGAEVVDVVTLNSSYTATDVLTPADGPFRWSVVTVGDDGQQGQFPVDDSPLWREFDLLAPPAAGPTPTQITPAIGASSGELPNFSWTPVTGADRYQVKYQVQGVPTEFNLGGVVRNSAFTPTTTLPEGTYDWRVVALNSGGGQIASSGLREFSVAPFSAVDQHLPSPCITEPCVLTTSPLLEWDPVPHANYYKVYLAFDANFTNLYRTYETQYNSFRPREEIRDSNAGEVYYWHVRPCVTEARCAPDPVGTLAPSSTFQKVSDPVRAALASSGPPAGPAVPRLPANTSTATDEPRFQWGDYLRTNPSDVGARNYRIQVAVDPNYTDIIDNRVVDQTFYTPYALTYPEGPLYWRVRAIDQSGNELSWSESWRVDKATPPITLIQPAHNAVIPGQPTFTWNNQDGAGNYWIEVYKDDPTRAFAPVNRIILVETAHTSYTPSIQLPVAEGYSWRVRRDDGSNKQGPWNAGRNFSITGGAPSLVSPNTGAEFVTPDIVFDWNPVPRAAQYRLQTSNTGFTSFRENQTTVMTTWSTTTTYTGGTWSWRVQALDAEGGVLGTSPVRTFDRIVVPLPSAPRNFEANPLPGQLRMTWLPPATPGSPAFTSYELIITRNTGPDIVRNLSVSATSVTVSGLFNGDVHSVSIRAKAGAYFGPPATDSAAPNGCAGTPFSDVSAANVFCANIRWMFEEGITVGTPVTDGRVLYRPADPVSRQSMAAFLYRYDGEEPQPPNPQRFADVEGDNPFYEPIQWMWNDGLSFGTPNPAGGLPLYRPMDLVARQSMAAFVNRYDDGGVIPTSTPQRFPDVPPSNPFYLNIQWMWETDLSVGSPDPGGGDNLYKPADAVTRGAMAAFIFRLDQFLSAP